MQCHSQKESSLTGQRAQRGYTLIELMVVVTIILVLSSIGVFLYSRAIAHAKDTVCKTNLKTLNEAVILYLEEYDAFPASLGHLKREHLEKGYAKAMSERRWHEKLCFFLLTIEESESAYAQFLTYENLKKFGATQKAFQCPTAAEGAISYGINADLVGKRLSEISDNMILIADCDSLVFSSPDQIRRRHAANKGFAVRKGGQIAEVSEKNVSLLPQPADTEPTLSTAPVDSPPSTTPDVSPTPADKPRDNLPTDLDSSVTYFDDLVNNNRNTPVADKAEDVRNKLLTALDELSKSTPDTAAAKGNIEGAESDLNAMIKDKLIDAAKGSALKKVLQDISKKL